MLNIYSADDNALIICFPWKKIHRIKRVFPILVLDLAELDELD